MWYIVKTDVFTEQKSIDLLGEKFKDTIVDFYFPMGRRTYKNELGEKKVRFTPVLQGLFFIRVQSEERLESILSQYGYFMYKGVDYRARSAEVVERTFSPRHIFFVPIASLEHWMKSLNERRYPMMIWNASSITMTR